MNNFEVEIIDLTNLKKVSAIKEFLNKFNLDYENVDTTIVVYAENKIVATCSKLENLVKCIAIDDQFKNHNLTNLLISEISKIIYHQDYQEVLIITKAINKNIFLDLNFEIIFLNSNIVFLTSNIQYYNDYKSYLNRSLNKFNQLQKLGVIIMNANPFTKGHEYLINSAVKKVDHLFIIIVKEDKSFFSYEERKAMVVANTINNRKITVLDGSEYIISHRIFPTYFAKSFEQATMFHGQMDAEIFCELFKNYQTRLERFVGDEPFSKTTKVYNEILKETLSNKKIGLKIIKRLKINNQEISASNVRQRILELKPIDRLVPVTTLNLIDQKEIYQRAVNHQELIAKNN